MAVGGCGTRPNSTGGPGGVGAGVPNALELQDNLLVDTIIFLEVEVEMLVLVVEQLDPQLQEQVV